MKKKILIMLITLSFILSVGYVSEVLKFGNSTANLTIEQAKETNIYDFKFNVGTNEYPIFEIYDDIGAVAFKSFGERIFGYNNMSDTMYFNKDVSFNEGFGIEGGVTENVVLENYTLVIEKGIIVEVIKK